MTDTKSDIAERADGRNYLIQKGGYWYRPDCAGYTSNPHEAGRYTKEEAHSESHPNGPDGPRDAMRYFHVSEVKWPALTSDATRIEALEASLAEAREALERIASFDYEHDDTEMQIVCAEIARAALRARGKQ